MSRQHARLNRRRWERVRRAVLDRDRWRCQKCGRAGRLEIDHVVPLDAGGAVYDMDNLQALCRGCHIDKTAGENRNPVPREVAEWRDLVAELLP